MLTWILPFSLLILFELVADIFAKQWSVSGRPHIWLVAIVAYCLANFFWLFALKNGVGLGRGAVMFSLVSEALAIIVGLYFFKEHITLMQGVGILLGVVSLVLLIWE